MKKGIFVRKGNVGFTGLAKIKESGRGRTLVVCPFCYGDAVKNSKGEKGEFVCQKCVKKFDPKNVNVVKHVKKVPSQPWWTV